MLLVRFSKQFRSCATPFSFPLMSSRYLSVSGCRGARLIDPSRKRRPYGLVLSYYKQNEIKNLSKRDSEHVNVYSLPQKHPMDREQIIDMAKCLQKNLPVRVAKMVMAFQSLPFSLAVREDILEIQEAYIETFHKLSLFPEIERRSVSGQSQSSPDLEKTWENVISYTNCLQDTLSCHEDTLVHLINGFSDLTIESRKLEAQNFMNRVIAERLALRLVCNHIVEIVNALSLNEYEIMVRSGKVPRFMGVFDLQFNPVQFVKRLFKEQQELCISMYGPNVPEVDVQYVKADEGLHLDDKGNFKYIPHALEYILKEILKNSLRAQIDDHQKEYGINSIEPHKNVKVLITATRHDFIIKVSDQGKGVPHEKIAQIWNYHTTIWKEGSEDLSSFFDMAGGPARADDKALSGYGCGLPISKVYAEKMGGSIQMESVQGRGTDLYIRMPYLDSLEDLKNVEELFETTQNKSNEVYKTLRL